MDLPALPQIQSESLVIEKAILSVPMELPPSMSMVEAMAFLKGDREQDAKKEEAKRDEFMEHVKTWRPGNSPAPREFTDTPEFVEALLAHIARDRSVQDVAKAMGFVPDDLVADLLVGDNTYSDFLETMQELWAGGPIPLELFGGAVEFKAKQGADFVGNPANQLKAFIDYAYSVELNPGYFVETLPGFLRDKRAKNIAYRFRNDPFKMAEEITKLANIGTMGKESLGERLARNKAAWYDEAPLLPPEICGLFYKGEVNEIHTSPGVGKTNVALYMALTVVREGGRVLYLDPESNVSETLRGRLKSFGITAEEWLERFDYLDDLSSEYMNGALEFAKASKPDFVVLDGLNEVTSMLGKNGNHVEEVLPVLNQYAKGFAKLGAGVLVVDHIAKGSNGDTSMGSISKIGHYKGAVYHVELGAAYAPNKVDKEGAFVAGEAGFVKLRLIKDNAGRAGAKDRTIAEMHFTPHPTELRTFVEIKAPTAKEVVEQAKNDSLVRGVLYHVEHNPGCSGEDIRDNITGDNKKITAAVKEAADKGLIRIEKEGNRRKHYFVCDLERTVNLPLVPPKPTRRPEKVK